MPPDLKDANTEPESSLVPNDVSGETQVPSAEGSSPSETVPGNAKTLADVVNDVLAKKAESQPAEETERSGDVQELDTTEKGQEAKEEPQPKKDELPPFHEHPRWKELVTERDELRENYEQAKPAVESYRTIETFCQQNRVTPEQFQEVLELAALANNDPAALLARLKPIVTALGQYDSNAIDADLQARITEGEISEKAAQEMMQLRANARKQEFAGKVSQQQQAVQQRAAVANALTAWQQAKRKTNPDYKPTDGWGVYEQVRARFQQLVAMKTPVSPEDHIRLAEQAYGEVSKAQPALAKPTKRTPSSTQSSVQSNGQPKTLQEAVNAALAKHQAA